MRTKLALALLSSAFALAACSDGSPDLPSGPARLQPQLTSPLASVTPYVVEGEATCAGINASWTEFRIDGPAPGSHGSPDSLVQVTLSSSDGIRFDWSAPGLEGPYVAAVLVSGGSSANVYMYTPPVTSDVGLHSPVGASGQPVAPDHISICYDRDIVILNAINVGVWAFGRFRRTWSWEINKFADQSSLTLPIGERVLVNYGVDAAAWYVDSDQQVYGYIWVSSWHYFFIQDVQLTLTVSSGIDRFVSDCYVFSWCDYFLRVADNSSGVHVMMKATSGDDTREFPAFDIFADFSVGEREEIDEEIEVRDDQYGLLWSPFAWGEHPYETFYYSRYVGPYASCGKYTVSNTASFMSEDLHVTGSDTWDILVDVPCLPACTFGYGYWKTHSRFGPAPYDDAWAKLGEDTPFFLSGKSYYQVLWTPPAGGNAYYILAHAYIAAKLNLLNGADPAAAQAAMASAIALFNAYTPGANLSRSVRAQFISTAAALDSYNNGVTGPGHCSS